MIRKKNSRLSHKESIQIEILLNENKSKEFKSVFNKNSSFTTYHNIMNLKELTELIEMNHYGLKCP